ncbi:hypothetical protein M422DRAFT_48268 [Sphaerobolus stellatus SS14]|uniref:Winged helix-turn helix domain-containing protein n=1 Tax=Sphaerobolus stellatus (strain SS14) TaxID=990650 RepID=A0A0C9V691_SPHS4|nr:hypothetical protein M422DRAFT_48268 [Sphaerobolus stellatus SS14]
MSNTSCKSNDATAKQPKHRHYGKDLWERIIYQQFSLGRKPAQISHELDISLWVIQQTLQLWNEIGNLVHDPKEYAKRGQPMVLDEMACNYMMHLLDEDPDLYLDEIALELTETLGVTPALSTIHRTLEMLGYSTKKLSETALEHCESSRQDFLFKMSEESPEQLVFIDESAVNVLSTYRSMG